MFLTAEAPTLLELLPLWTDALGFLGVIGAGILSLWGVWKVATINGRADVAAAKAEGEAQLKAALAQAEVDRERTLLDGLAERVKHLEERVERLETENRELESENAALRSTNLTLEETLAASIELIKAWEAFEDSGFSTPPGRPSPTWPIRPYLKPPEEVAHKVAQAAEKLQEVLDD